jgi:hypothetical protein
LKVQGGKITKGEDKNGGPIPENCIRKGRQGKIVSQLVAIDLLVA